MHGRHYGVQSLELLPIRNTEAAGGNAGRFFFTAVLFFVRERSSRVLHPASDCFAMDRSI
jgi:hypothetical protein